jgi:hypothetical protein
MEVAGVYVPLRGDRGVRERQRLRALRRSRLERIVPDA